MPRIQCYRHIATALAVAVSFCLAPGIHAQPAPYGITVENDHFSYWLPRGERPDREYSSGVLMHFPMRSAPSTLHALAGEARPCTGREAPAQACTVAGLTVGQKLYTPTPWRPKPGERPYAGWLFTTLAVERATWDQRRQVGLEVGVTGPPSLGEAVQSEVHRRRGHGLPVGWDQQIGFEPAFSLRVTESRVLAAPGSDAALGALVTGSLGGNVGTLQTGATAGLEARAGLRPPHPWRRSAAGPNGRMSLYGIAGVAQHAVLRNLMLDGNTFGSGPRVQRRPLVREWTAGAGVRLGRVGVEFRGVVRGPEYATQEQAHPYGSFTLTLDPR